MPAYLKPQEWLSVLRTEYLQSFILSGGAAVKFVIPSEEFETVEIKTGLQKLAGESGFLFASVDASATKIHLIEHIFFQVARQVDWEGLAYSFLRNSLEGHYKLPDNREQFNLKNLAFLNEYDEPEMRRAINERLKKALYQDYAMTQEFRLAMVRLCQAQLDPAEVSAELCDTVKSWLRGELRRMSALKPALIFQRIGRHNARHLLFSLSHWLRISGHNGLVLVLDISRYLQERPKGLVETLYYSKPAVLDCYEVLRQFIDETDEAEFLFTVVLAPTRFLNEDERRSVHWYQALKLRIWNEVHDKVHANPLSPLVRVSSCSHTETDRGQGL
ncbi:MAG: DUF2791 family P-loop domain-containing protein [Dehalococcoidia bacterium]|nr:DUF2791 family P-loop domain-containing protein [Dehalococcoidia bacterium]